MARTQVTVIGVGERKQGMTKATATKVSRPYDFVPVYVTYDDPEHVKGSRCLDTALNVSICKDFNPNYLPSVGDILDCFVQYNGYTRRNEIGCIFDVTHA